MWIEKEKPAVNLLWSIAIEAVIYLQKVLSMLLFPFILFI